MQLGLVALLNFCLNAFVLIVLLLFSKQTLRKIKNVLSILDNGGYRECPHYADQRERGRRWYDENHLRDLSLNLPCKGEGGDNL
jgi:hypothetical protein